ncbi:aldo/keto reductase [Roseofilum casamattae]|uniref:Aldo/keto reductase n=1 Tax=Roseofilum casamattae BLCC-M143 TaxID=3022442 RepID=A0ABT7BS26_9CYAN|nr:aldo/keto reductase [Roseofilum casamattae]MDJ1181989.1 aldo/keto reductase [Roseofilum casamattae BLCC-M143]
MQYRRFGQTNLNLSVFSLGTMRSLSSEDAFHQTVLHALELGINHLETARGYGRSESYLGRSLSQLDREQLYITTKLPPTADPEMMAGWIEESLTRLQVKTIDCVAIHGINTWEQLESVVEGGLGAVRDAIAAGKVGHVGFSTHGSTPLIEAAIQTNLFEFVNLHYYWSLQRHANALELARERDMGIFIISPADKGGQLYNPPERLQQLCAPFNPLELTYRFLLSDRRITTLSIGPARPEELDCMKPICDRDETLTSEEEAVLFHLNAYMSALLGATQCHQCDRCLPCPQDINIPEVLRLRNLALAYDMVDYGKYRYAMFEQAGHWFPGNKASRCNECGDCLPRCPVQLEIPQLLSETHELLKGKSRRRLWDD